MKAQFERKSVIVPSPATNESSNIKTRKSGIRDAERETRQLDGAGKCRIARIGHSEESRTTRTDELNVFGNLRKLLSILTTFKSHFTEKFLPCAKTDVMMCKDSGNTKRF